MNDTAVVLVGCDTDPRALEFVSSLPGTKKIFSTKTLYQMPTRIDHVVILGSPENEEHLRKLAANIGRNPDVISVSVYTLPTSENKRRSMSLLHTIFSGLVPRKNSVRHGQLVCSTIREY